MKNILSIIILGFIVISCNKESHDECEIFEEQLLGEYCTVSEKDYSNSYSIEKLTTDTFLLSTSEFSLKFQLNSNHLIINRQKVVMPVEWIGEPIRSDTIFYSGTGNVNCSTGLIELTLEIEMEMEMINENTESHHTNKETLLKSSEFNFVGTFLSNDNNTLVRLSHDPNSDSLIINVDMEYLNARDSLLINLKAFQAGCGFIIDFDNTDSTNIYGWVAYKENELLFNVAECPLNSSSRWCDFSNGMTLSYWVNCCEEFIHFEGKRVE